MYEAYTYIESLSKPRSTQIMKKLELGCLRMLNPNENWEVVSHTDSRGERPDLSASQDCSSVDQ